MAAESVTISVDGSRVRASGFADPADLFRDILELGLANRRVDFSLGLKGPTDQDIVLVMPMFSGKINSPKLLYPQHAVGAVQSPGQHNDATLEFILDSLAIRYQWTSGRTRSNEDQLEVDPTDKFYAYVGDNLTRESTLYWGKTGPMTQAQNQAWLQGVVDQFF
jgi:hypothetical protein